MRHLNHLARFAIAQNSLQVETHVKRLRELMGGMIVLEVERRYDTMDINYLVDDPSRFPRTEEGGVAPMYWLDLSASPPEFTLADRYSGW